MRKLTVKNFSVIKEAELELGKITVLIGPQSSGKSLLCKLAFFFGREVIDIAIERVVNRSEFPDFVAAIHREFEKWFPSGGWGGEEWSIEFTSGVYTVGVSCRRTGKQTIQVSVMPGDRFKEAYLKRLNETAIERDRTGFLPPVEILRSLAASEFLGLAERGVWDASTYVPLERSYFVDTQKGYKVLGGETDPISAKFANILADSMNLDAPKLRVTRFLDGKLFLGRDDWEIEFLDGRVLPIDQLSSGSKEILPILAVLDYYEHRRRIAGSQLRTDELYGKRLYFFDDFTIEEPEASVFPQTQYDLVQQFASLSNESNFQPYFTITTHSPYILSVFGDLVKAGKVGTERPENRAAVAKVIPEQFWIKDTDFAAFKIENGKLVSIFDKKTGQIDGDYLDNVSGKIGEEFGQLLEIQYGG